MKPTEPAVGGSGASRDAVLRIATIALMSLLLGACALLGKGEPIQVLDPSAKVSPSPDWPQARWSLLVMRLMA
jgi:ABC-type uncharacterized transport system auxiliary subunit